MPDSTPTTPSFNCRELDRMRRSIREAEQVYKDLAEIRVLLDQAREALSMDQAVTRLEYDTEVISRLIAGVEALDWNDEVKATERMLSFALNEAEYEILLTRFIGDDGGVHWTDDDPPGCPVANSIIRRIKTAWEAGHQCP